MIYYTSDKKQDYWCDSLNFFYIELTNGELVNWWTDISYDEAKELIKTESFVTISSGQDYEKRIGEYNTKAILTIKDMTESERKRFRHNQDWFNKKMDLVTLIRVTKQPLFTRFKIKQVDKMYLKKQLTWHDYFDGANIDPLMSLDYSKLKKLAEK